jgi:hypothetical protein
MPAYSGILLGSEGKYEVLQMGSLTLPRVMVAIAVLLFLAVAIGFASVGPVALLPLGLAVWAAASLTA